MLSFLKFLAVAFIDGIKLAFTTAITTFAIRYGEGIGNKAAAAALR